MRGINRVNPSLDLTVLSYCILSYIILYQFNYFFFITVLQLTVHCSCSGVYGVVVSLTGDNVQECGVVVNGGS